ncbi:MAG TPA: hypothetical protein VGK04_05985 [Thermoanaerobaculia bacterium]|jgi:hypothetical protein
MIFFAAASFACNCPSWSLAENFDNAATVFLGHVSNARELPKTHKVQLSFTVIENFKGTPSALHGTLTTSRWEATCGVPVPVGRDYVFFVGRDGTVSRCSGTFELDRPPKLDEHAAEIRKLAADRRSQHP